MGEQAAPRRNAARQRPGDDGTGAVAFHFQERDTMTTPDAYGLLDEGDVHYATPFRDEAEAVLRRTGDTDSAIVALYRSPTLTDAEREAVEAAIDSINGVEDISALWSQRETEAIATLRGLLERCSQFAKRESDRPQPIAKRESDRSQPIDTPEPLSTPAECSVPSEWTETGEAR